MGILYLSTKFELDRSTNNGDLLSDRTKAPGNTDKHTNSHTETETDILPIYYLGSSNKFVSGFPEWLVVHQSEKKSQDLSPNLATMVLRD